MVCATRNMTALIAGMLQMPCWKFSWRPLTCTAADVVSDFLVRTRVKDAICDAARDAGRGKPLPPESGYPADLPLFVSCFQVR